MSNRVNVEEVWKNCDGEFNGMSSGKTYMKNEVEQIGPFFWTKPAPAPDRVVIEREFGEDDQDKDWKNSGVK